METREIWFERILTETKKVVIQAGKHVLKKYPILHDSFDDLIQDTYLELYKNYDKLRKHENITGWLVETMYRKAKGSAKRLYKEANRTSASNVPNEVLENMSSDLDDTPERTYMQQENASELCKALSKVIGNKAYRLLEAYYVDGIPLDSLAKHEGITPSALKMRFFRWKRRVQKKRNKLKC